MEINLSLVAVVIGGVCAIKLARALVHHALKKEVKGEPFSWLRVTYLTLATAAMVIVVLRL